jgi:hypothetical protein
MAQTDDAASYGISGEAARRLRRIRWLLAGFIVGLVLSGLTAFPLLTEVTLVARFLRIDPAVGPDAYSGLQYWIALVRHGLAVQYAQYPYLAYGTDWLAFAHVVIALFFVGPLLDPVRNVWCLRAGMAACVLVLPLALVCGPIRGIPFGWRLIDCSFGVVGIVPLWIAFRDATWLERAGPHGAVAKSRRA